MLTSIIIIAAVVVLTVGSYSLGFTNGEHYGIDKTLKEDLLRLDIANPCMDDHMYQVVESLVADAEAYQDKHETVKAIMDSLPD
jgi:hypothetical protein